MTGISRRGRRALRRPFPGEWRQILEQRIPRWSELGTAEQARLEDLIRVFVAETDWEGVDGFEVTNEMRVVVASGACTLLAGLETNRYPNVSSVILFPRTPVRKQVRRIGGGIIDESVMHLGGEAHPSGPVMLVWPSVLRPRGGRNVVLHEFAHKLDMADGYTDGIPAMVAAADRPRFDALFDAAFIDLTEGAGFLDLYATTSRVEFFAVATETFFENPTRLVEGRPELYRALVEVYGQDPGGS
jgi:MtfA peptidase